MYEDGLGVERDYPRAVVLYQDAANHGAIRGEFNLAVLYSSGRGVPLDYVSAYMWFSRAASAGDSLAARNLKNLETVMTPHQKEQAQARLADGQDARLSEARPHFLFDAGMMSQR